MQRSCGCIAEDYELVGLFQALQMPKAIETVIDLSNVPKVCIDEKGGRFAEGKAGFLALDKLPGRARI
jgi:hypothetical protein